MTEIFPRINRQNECVSYWIISNRFSLAERNRLVWCIEEIDISVWFGGIDLLVFGSVSAMLTFDWLTSILIVSIYRSISCPWLFDHLLWIPRTHRPGSTNLLSACSRIKLPLVIIFSVTFLNLFLHRKRSLFIERWDIVFLWVPPIKDIRHFFGLTYLWPWTFIPLKLGPPETIIGLLDRYKWLRNFFCTSNYWF